MTHVRVSKGHVLRGDFGEGKEIVVNVLATHRAAIYTCTAACVKQTPFTLSCCNGCSYLQLIQIRFNPIDDGGLDFVLLQVVDRHPRG